MPNRPTLVSAFVFVAPISLVLLALLLLARPSSSVPASTTGAAPPTNPPAPSPRPSGRAAPELSGGGTWIKAEPPTLASLR